MISIVDRLAIEDLYSRYCWANDGGDADAWAATFLEDGVYEGLDRTVEGRAAIRELVASRIANRANQPIKNPQHWTGNLLLDGDGNSAQGRCYYVRFVQSKESGVPKVDTTGWYIDELRKVGGKWGFKKRSAVRDMPLVGAD